VEEPWAAAAAPDLDVTSTLYVMNPTDWQQTSWPVTTGLQCLLQQDVSLVLKNKTLSQTIHDVGCDLMALLTQIRSYHALKVINNSL